MPGVDGIEATRRLCADGEGAPRVLMLTTFDQNEYVYEAMKAGASGFLLKDVRREELVNAVRVVAAGDAMLAPTLTRRLIEDFVRRPPPGRGRARRARRADRARARGAAPASPAGCSNAEIAGELVVSEATVKTHVARILSKLGLRDRIQVVVLAYETGFVQPGEGEPCGGSPRTTVTFVDATRRALPVPRVYAAEAGSTRSSARCCWSALLFLIGVCWEAFALSPAWATGWSSRCSARGA